jgi:hypothetical protein
LRDARSGFPINVGHEGAQVLLGNALDLPLGVT